MIWPSPAQLLILLINKYNRVKRVFRVSKKSNKHRHTRYFSWERHDCSDSRRTPGCSSRRAKDWCTALTPSSFFNFFFSSFRQSVLTESISCSLISLSSKTKMTMMRMKMMIKTTTMLKVNQFSPLFPWLLLINLCDFKYWISSTVSSLGIYFLLIRVSDIYPLNEFWCFS